MAGLMQAHLPRRTVPVRWMKVKGPVSKSKAGFSCLPMGAPAPNLESGGTGRTESHGRSLSNSVPSPNTLHPG